MTNCYLNIFLLLNFLAVFGMMCSIYLFIVRDIFSEPNQKRTIVKIKKNNDFFRVSNCSDLLTKPGANVSDPLG